MSSMLCATLMTTSLGIVRTTSPVAVLRTVMMGRLSRSSTEKLSPRPLRSTWSLSFSIASCRFSRICLGSTSGSTLMAGALGTAGTADTAGCSRCSRCSRLWHRASLRYRSGYPGIRCDGHSDSLLQPSLSRNSDTLQDQKVLEVGAQQENRPQFE